MDNLIIDVINNCSFKEFCEFIGSFCCTKIFSEKHDGTVYFVKSATIIAVIISNIYQKKRAMYFALYDIIVCFVHDTHLKSLLVLINYRRVGMCYPPC